MYYPRDIPALEAQLARVRGMVREDEAALARSSTPYVERIFLETTKKLYEDVRVRLQLAKAEQARVLAAETSALDA